MGGGIPLEAILSVFVVLLAIVLVICAAVVVHAGVHYARLAFCKTSKEHRLSSFSRFFIGLTPVVLAIILFLPNTADEKLNGLTGGDVPVAGPAALALHKSLTIVDLHADTLMWSNRDMNLRSSFGHVDVPRMIEGNVAIQAFTLVTKSPFAQNFEGNDNTTDVITILSAAQRWPLNTWRSPMNRAVFQCRRLVSAARDSHGALRVIRTKADLETFLKERKASPRPITAGFLGVEGLHALEGKLENLDVLFQEGVRMAALPHFFDNLLGGSAHGLAKYGLTPLGRQVLERMQELGIMIDIAHSSPALIDDILSVATQPIMVSHTGVRGTCNVTRNLSDEHLLGVAASGGVVGIAYFKQATCGQGVRDIAAAIEYTGNLIGWEHVSLGSDFDGTVATPVDTSRLASITQELLDAPGVPDDAIPGIMGDNALRLLARVLPEA